MKLRKRFRQWGIYYAMQILPQQNITSFLFDVDPASPEMSNLIKHLGETANQIQHVRTIPLVFKQKLLKRRFNAPEDYEVTDKKQTSNRG